MKKLIILFLILLLAGCQQQPEVIVGQEVISKVGHITAPENNTFKMGVKNFDSEFKANITEENALQYKLDDKYVAFKPLGMAWNTSVTPDKVIVSSLKEGREYKDIFGEGIDLEMKEGERTWKKIIRINSLEDLGDIPKDAEYLEIAFAFDTNFVIDGWDKKSEMEIKDKVRVGDYSYLEPARAWDSYSKEVCYLKYETYCDPACTEDTETCDMCDPPEEICEIETHSQQIKSFLSEGVYKKQIPVEWIKNATFPIWTDADLTYGTLQLMSTDNNNVGQMRLVKITDTSFGLTWQDGSDGYSGQMSVSSISGTTITAGTQYEFVGAIKGSLDVCYGDSGTLVALYDDDALLDDGYARACDFSGTTISGCGTAKEFNATDTEHIACTSYNDNAVFMFYNDESNSDRVEAVACTLSGTTFTCGTTITFDADHRLGSAKKSDCEKFDTDHVICSFTKYDGDDVPILFSATISTRTITKGTELTATTTAGSSFSGDNVIETFSTTEFCFSEMAITPSYEQFFWCGDVSGTTITLGEAYYVTSTSTTLLGNGLDFAAVSADKAVVSWRKARGGWYVIDSMGFDVDFSSRIIEDDYQTGISNDPGFSISSSLVEELTETQVVICYQYYGVSGQDRELYCHIGEIPAEAPADTCTYGGSGDWNVLYSDNCYITVTTYVNGDFNLIYDGAGSFGLTAEIGCDNLNIGTGATAQMLNGTASFEIY